MSNKLGTDGIRRNMEAVMNSLLDGSLPPETAKEVCNAAGKYLTAIKIDLVGEAMRQKVGSFNHECLSLTGQSVIDVEKG